MMPRGMGIAKNTTKIRYNAKELHNATLKVVLNFTPYKPNKSIRIKKLLRMNPKKGISNTYNIPLPR
jgi:hypothetical protein